MLVPPCRAVSGYPVICTPIAPCRAGERAYGCSYGVLGAHLGGLQIFAAGEITISTELKKWKLTLIGILPYESKKSVG